MRGLWRQGFIFQRGFVEREDETIRKTFSLLLKMKIKSSFFLLNFPHFFCYYFFLPKIGFQTQRLSFTLFFFFPFPHFFTFPSLFQGSKQTLPFMCICKDIPTSSGKSTRVQIILLSCPLEMDNQILHLLRTSLRRLLITLPEWLR